MTVVCLGEALIDLFPQRDHTLVDTDALSVRIGGAPLNVAIHLKRSGLDARFLGALSLDGFGDRIRALLQRENIDHQPIVPVNAPTRLAVIDHRDDKPPFRFYGDRPADTCLTSGGRPVGPELRDQRTLCKLVAHDEQLVGRSSDGGYPAGAS